MKAVGSVPSAPSDGAGSWTSIAWPLALVLGISVVAAIWLRPVVATALAGSPVREVAELALLAAAVFSPVVALLRAVLLSGVTLATSVLVEEPARFGPLLRVYLAAEIALACSGLAAALILWMRGADRLTSAADLAVPFSLDRLWTPANPMLVGMLREVTLFHVAWICVVAFGLRRRIGLSRGVALVGTIAGFAALVGIVAVRAAIIT